MKQLLIMGDGMKPLIYLTAFSYSFHVLYVVQKHVWIKSSSNITESLEKNDI